MKFICISSFYTLASLFLSFSSTAQEVTYTIYRGNSEIGEITASLTHQNNNEKYFITSNSEFKVIWKYTYETLMSVVYENGTLANSLSKTFMNDDLEEMSVTSRKSYGYQCFKHPDDTFEIKTPITFSTARLYFQEPLGIDNIYSESHLTHCKLEALGDQKYKLVLPEDKINYYTYRNNKLVEIYVDRSWFDIVFKLKED